MHLSLDDEAAPRGCLLSNGRYSVLLSGAGSGYSWAGAHAVTRFSGERVEDAEGIYLYLRDLEDGALWSVGAQPACRTAERYEAHCREGIAVIERLDRGVEARLEVCVSPGDDLELRALRLINRSGRPRRIEVTAYIEVVAYPPAADATHPAFSKLFIETEHAAGAEALLAHRRPRSAEESAPWVAAAFQGPGALSYETDRARFTGRGRTLARPLLLCTDAELSGTVGKVLDPCLALRRLVAIAPRRSARTCLLLGAPASREEALALVHRHRSWSAIDRAFQDASHDEGVLLRRWRMAGVEAERWQALGAALLYRHPLLRPPRGASQGGSGEALRRLGVTGERPLVLVEASPPDAGEQVREAVRAWRYWRCKGLHTDVVVLADGPGPSEKRVAEWKREVGLGPSEASGPGIFAVVRPLELPGGVLEDAESLAEAVVRGSLAALAARIMNPSGSAGRPAARTSRNRPASENAAPPADVPRTPAAALSFDNGYGGFAPDGAEYRIRIRPEGAGGQRLPPMPWVNVIANPRFGTLVSETGAGYTWATNSREDRLSPWANDPVCDPHGEAVYLRDEEARLYWSPCPGPAPSGAHYKARHGFGYSN